MFTQATTRQAVKVLKATRAYLSVPGNWTQHAFARTRSNKQCGAFSPEAQCFCLSGRIMIDENAHKVAGVERLFCSAVDLYTNIESFNDSSTHDGVMELLDKGIAELEKQITYTHEEVLNAFAAGYAALVETTQNMVKEADDNPMATLLIGVTAGRFGSKYALTVSKALDIDKTEMLPEKLEARYAQVQANAKAAEPA